MEEIIELIKKKYKSHFLYMELFDDLSGRLKGSDFTILYSFNSLEDLRNHLKRITNMNDRYLFRGKRIDNGEFIEGYIVFDPQGKCRIYCLPFDRASSNSFWFVDSETVGQFTGFTDKNGVKIFEGDRFKTPMGFFGKVEWGHKVYIDKQNKYECHGWIYVNDSNNHAETLDSEILAGEVIGNIYEK